MTAVIQDINTIQNIEQDIIQIITTHNIDCDYSKFLAQVQIQQYLTKQDVAILSQPPAVRQIQEMLLNQPINDLYKHVDLLHVSGKPLSEVFPQDIIYALLSNHDLYNFDSMKQQLELNLQENNNQIRQLGHNLQQAMNSSLKNEEEINNLKAELHKRQECINTLNTLNNEKARDAAKAMEYHQTTLTNQVDNFCQQLKTSYKHTFDAQSKIEELERQLANLLEKPTWNINCSQGKMNIGFVCVLCCMFISVISNVMQNYRYLQQQKNKPAIRQYNSLLSKRNSSF